MRESKLNLCLAATLLGIPVAFGCSSNNDSSSTQESQTLIQVVPSDFIDNGSCGTLLMSYVATLFDVTSSTGITDAGVSAGNFVVASTPPKSCEEATVFSNVVSAHAYKVELQGYVQSAAELSPAEPGLLAGSSAMLLNDNTYVTPEWTASCYGWRDRSGTPQPGYAYDYATMTLRTCTRLGSEP